MKLCNFDVQPRHGGAQRSAREGRAQDQPESVQL
jgi:hypothetical protein